MGRAEEEKIFGFLLLQHKQFRHEDWLSYPAEKIYLAAAALFLANGGWFGHVEELRSVAKQLYPEYAGSFSDLAKITRFDCSRFSSMLKERIKHV